MAPKPAIKAKKGAKCACGGPTPHTPTIQCMTCSAQCCKECFVQDENGSGRVLECGHVVKSADGDRSLCGAVQCVACDKKREANREPSRMIQCEDGRGGCRAVRCEEHIDDFTFRESDTSGDCYACNTCYGGMPMPR